jgi:hypothetical protein
MSRSSGLHQDMCGLSGPGVLRDEIDEYTIATSLPPDLQYACRYWVDHLKQGGQNIVDGDLTHLFLQKHLLHWLEAMSLISESSRCVDVLDSLQALASVRASLLDTALLTYNVAICMAGLGLSLRREAVRAAVPVGACRCAAADLLLCASIRTREEPDTTNICQTSARKDEDAVYGRNRLGRVSQHAGGPFLRCQGGGLLARRAAGRISIFGQYSTAVGDSNRDVSQHAGKPFSLPLLHWFLARRPDTSHWSRRYSFVSNTCCNIALKTAAAVDVRSSAESVDIAQPAKIPVASTRISNKVNCSTQGYSLSGTCIWSCSSAQNSLARA